MAVTGEYPHNFSFSDEFIKLEENPAYIKLMEEQENAIENSEIKIYTKEDLKQYCMQLIYFHLS